MYVLFKNCKIMALCEKPDPLRAFINSRNNDEYTVGEIPAITVSEVLNEKKNYRRSYKRRA